MNKSFMTSEPDVTTFSLVVAWQILSGPSELDHAGVYLHL